MVYRGLVRNGVIVLDDNLALPDGSVVTVHFTDLTPTNPSQDQTYNNPDLRSEKIDRLLGTLRHSTSDGMRAQQHLDRHL